MRSIRVIKKDGKQLDFPHEGRPGGSYTKKIRYEGSFVIIKDEYDHESIFSVSDIEKIETWEGPIPRY